jgi:hypothetical protein
VRSLWHVSSISWRPGRNTSIPPGGREEWILSTCGNKRRNELNSKTQIEKIKIIDRQFERERERERKGEREREGKKGRERERREREREREKREREILREIRVKVGRQTG